MRTFAQYLGANKTNRFMEWVLREGIYLRQEDLLEGVKDQINEWWWSKKESPAPAPEPEGQKPLRYKVWNRKDGTYFNDSGDDSYRGGPVDSPRSYGYYPHASDDDFDFRSEKEKAADELRNTQPLKDPYGLRFKAVQGFENTYTGHSQKFYNDAVTAIRGLMSRQPRIKAKLEGIIKALRQTLVDSSMEQAKARQAQAAEAKARQEQPRKAATDVSGMVAPPPMGPDDYARALQDRWEAK